MELRVDKKGDIIDAKVDLNDLKLDLQEAKINLEIARMTGKSDLMTQNIKNAALMLAERETSFNAKITRESALTSGQIDLDLYDAQVGFETTSEVNDIEFDAERIAVIKIARARIREKNRYRRHSGQCRIDE